MTAAPDTRDVTIRNMDTAIWRRFRAEAVARGIESGALLTEILSQWLKKGKPL